MAQAESRSVHRRANLSWVFQELLTAIVRLRFNRQSVPNADVFRSNMRELIRLAAQNAQSLGYSPDNVKLVTYAVVAFLDESVLVSRNPVFAAWAGKPMQEELFGQSLAGNTFYDGIQSLLSHRDSAEVADMLEVFYLCLLLGYRGRYGVANSGELHAIMESIKDKLRRVRGDNPALSPSWSLPSDLVAAPAPDKYRHLFLAVAVAALVIAIGTFTFCSLSLSSGAKDIGTFATQAK